MSATAATATTTTAATAADDNGVIAALRCVGANEHWTRLDSAAETSAISSGLWPAPGIRGNAQRE